MKIHSLLVVALLVLGPKRLPEMARSLGRGMAEFRRASNEFTRTLSASLDEPPSAPPPKRAPDSKNAADSKSSAGSKSTPEPDAATRPRADD